MSRPLEGKVALVAGATRGGGRGIAVALGEAGATVYATGRSTRERRSEVDRPETIEETAALVTDAGGEGIAVAVDHLDPEQVRALVARIDAEQGRLDVLVNDIWGGEHLFEWDTPVWEHDLANGLRLLRLAIDTHLITSHHALPLLIRRRGGLVVEVTDGTAAYNAERYRVNAFYDLAKTAAIRLAWSQAPGAARPRRDRRRADAGLDALGGDARALRRPRGQLARRRRAHAALLHLRDAALRRPRGRGARRRPGRRALERAVAVERAARAGLRVHRPRRDAARLLALPRRGPGGRPARGRRRLPLSRAIAAAKLPLDVDVRVVGDVEHDLARSARR